MPTDKLELTFESPKGAETIVLASSAPDPEKAYPFPDRDFAPQQQTTEDAPWASVLADRKEPDLPLVLRDPDHSLFHVALPGDGLYIHLNATSDDDRGDLGDQLAKLMAPIAPGTLKFAVLDLALQRRRRLYEDAHVHQGAPEEGRARWEGLHPHRPRHVLRGARHGRTGQVLRRRSRGDPRRTARGRLQFWAEAGSPIVLPNSKIRVFFATGYHDWEHGCGWSDLGRCFWLNYPFAVPAGDLAPKKPVAWKFADYRAGRDHGPGFPPELGFDLNSTRYLTIHPPKPAVRRLCLAG
jgi:hypothetical protein